MLQLKNIFHNSSIHYVIIIVVEHFANKRIIMIGYDSK